MTMSKSEILWRNYLLSRLTEHGFDRGLETLGIHQKLRPLYRMFCKHQFQLTMAVSEYVDLYATNPFEAQQWIVEFQRTKEETLDQLAWYAETSPDVKGDTKRFIVEECKFVHSDSFMLDDGLHLVVVTKFKRDQFVRKWFVLASERERFLFNKVHVYKWSDGRWIISYDEFAEQYREAYQKMREFMQNN
jgi:hypothetical protein